MSYRKRVSLDEVMKAKEVDLLSYLESKGEQFRKEGRYYRHVEHDSLIIRDNMYAWNSRGEKGHGAINFAKMYYGMSFVEAVQEINNGEHSRELVQPKLREDESKKPFFYPKENEVDSQVQLKKYLVNEREIDSRVVDWLLRKDLIAQDKRNNIVFKWKDNGNDGEVIGYDLQGTVKMKNKHGTFKHICPESKDHRGFTIDVGTPKAIYMYESPIDMLSHWSLKGRELQDARLISMNGLKPKTVFQAYHDAKKEKLPLQKIVFAVDHDDAGLEFIKKMERVANKDVLSKELPPEKGMDWNDTLKKQRSLEQEIRNSRISQRLAQQLER